MTPSRVRLIVFAKAPVGGGAKTRLAREMGVVATAAWYRRALIRTLTMLDRARMAHEVAAAPSAAVFAATSPMRARAMSQSIGNLGRRMATAARRAGGPSLIFGVDIPALSPAIVAAAREAVTRFDLVLGPARDGGFYLIGVRTPAHAFRLYDGVRWSSEHALADTLANVPKHWRIAFLPTLNDVDVAADLAAAGQPPGAYFSASRGRISTRLQG